VRCERHQLEAGPDGRCTLCKRAEVAKDRTETVQGDRKVRRVLKIVLAAVAGIATFSLLMAAFDTNRRDPEQGPVTDGGEEATLKAWHHAPWPVDALGHRSTRRAIA
jgi:hypothetical protein